MWSILTSNCLNGWYFHLFNHVSTNYKATTIQTMSTMNTYQFICKKNRKKWWNWEVNAILYLVISYHYRHSHAKMHQLYHGIYNIEKRKVCLFWVLDLKKSMNLLTFLSIHFLVSHALQPESFDMQRQASRIPSNWHNKLTHFIQIESFQKVNITYIGMIILFCIC